MLQILVNNIPLVLDPKTKIRIEMNTSYFNVDEIMGDVVWHFDLPAFGNEETFNYSNFITVRNKFKYYQCRIQMFGIPIGRGQMVISKSTNKTFRVAVSLNSFGVDFADVSLNEASYTEERIGGETHTEAAVLQHAKEVNNETIKRDYRFPMVYAPEFYGDNAEFNTDFGLFMNAWTDGAFISNEPESLIVDNKQSLVPFPMLLPVVKKLLSQKGYSVSGALVQQEYLNDLLLFNNVSLDSFLSNYYLHATSDYYDVYYPEGDQVIKLELVLQDEFDTFLNNTYLVRETGRYWFEAKVMAYGGISSVKTEVKNGKVVKKTYTTSAQKGEVSIFVNDVAVLTKSFDYPRQTGFPPAIPLSGYFNFNQDDKVNVQVNFEGGGVIRGKESHMKTYLVLETPGQNVHVNQMKFQDYIPDVKVTSLINSLRNAFFMAVFFDDENKKVETELLKDVLSNNNYVDVTNHIVKDSQETTPEESKTVELKWNHTEDLNDIDQDSLINNTTYFADLVAQYQKSYALLSGSNAVYVYDSLEDDSDPVWSFYRHNFNAYGNEGSTLKPSIDICPMPAQEVNGKIYPFTTKKGISHKVPDKEDSIGVQLLHWYGVHDIPVALPLAAREGNEVLGPLSIDFNGTTGIISQLGIDWLSFIAKSEEFKILLTDVNIWKLLEIMSLFLPKKKVDHPRWVLANNVKALPKQFTAEIDINAKITASELVLVKKSE